MKRLILVGILILGPMAHGAEPTGPIGRFQVVVVPNGAIKIDTVTGKAWRLEQVSVKVSKDAKEPSDVAFWNDIWSVEEVRALNQP